MANTFDTAYGPTPWENFETNQYTKYVPELLETFRKRSIWYGMVTYGVNLAAARTGRMIFTQIIDPEPNTAPLDERALWLPQLYMDSRSLEIVAARYGDKIQLHKYDEYITYWRENGEAGLRRIIAGRLAPHMVQSLDLLARNAFLSNTRRMFAGSASSFGTITASDTFDPDVCRAIWLGADYQPDPVSNPIFGIVSPSAVYTIRGDDTGEFIDRMKYADGARLINYEFGTYEGIRFARHPSVTLWNCGEIIAQTTITQPISRGDGAPDPSTTKVDNVWMVGQPGATHYITVADASGFEVGDIVTLHRNRASADSETAVQDGVIYDDSYNRVRVVHSVNGNQITFTEPILDEWFESDLGGGVYGYLTKARPVHAAVFIKGPRGVVAGVLQPPQTYTPWPMDDTLSIFRFSWDAYMEYQVMYPERLELYFHAGPIRRLGEVVNL